MKRVYCKFFAALITFLFMLNIFANSQVFTLAENAGGAGYDFGTGVTTDNAGNFYGCGHFSDICSFDSEYLSSTSGFDGYVVKYKPNGSIRWARSFGGPLDDYASSICCDDSCNVYVSAYIRVSASFDSLTVTSNGLTDGVIVKYDSAGQLIWVKQIGGANEDDCKVVKYRNNNLYAIGNFSGTAVFDQNDTLTNLGQPDAYIVKLDVSGNIIWVKQLVDVNAAAISVNDVGDVVISGTFEGSLTLDGIAVTSVGGEDILIAKYASNGTVLWAKNYGGSYTDKAGEVEIAPDGSIFFCGQLLGSVSIGNITVSGPGQMNLFHIETDGDVQWIKRADANPAFALAVDDFGDAYVSGSFFGGAKFQNDSLFGKGGYFVRYNKNGLIKWAKQTTANIGSCQPSDICADGDSSVYVTGMFAWDAAFGQFSLNGDGSNDIFFTRISTGGAMDLNDELLNIVQENVYPNPAMEMLVVEIKGIFSNLTFSIFDMMGRSVGSYELDVNRTSIDISQLSHATYFYRIESPGMQATTGKFIKD